MYGFHKRPIFKALTSSKRHICISHFAYLSCLILNMMKDTSNWSKDEFLGFCLAFAAHSDHEIVEEERDLISEMVGEEIAEASLKLIQKFNDVQRLDLIRNYKEQYYPTEEAKTELIEKMREVCLADQKFHTLENMSVRFLGRML